MIKILVCIEDKLITDIVKTAFKQFPGMSAWPVPKRQLLEFLREPDWHAVVVDLERFSPETTAFVESIRRTNSEIEILTLLDQDQKDRFNRLKVDLGIFTYISVPIDPFELARRIVRLEKHVIEKQPMRL